MTAEELKELKQAVKEVVAESHGVIHSDTQKRFNEVQKQIEELKDDLKERMDKIDERLTRQEEAQKKMEPTVTAIANLTWAGKIAVAFVIALGAIVGALMAIEGYIKAH